MLHRQILATAILISTIISSIIPQLALARLPITDSKLSLAPMLTTVKPSIVNILATGKNPRAEELFSGSGNDKQNNKKPPKKEFESIGSGVIIDADKGYILTNAHLIEKATTVTVTLNDGRHFKAKLIGKDPDSDIAVIQVKATNLAAIKIADSQKLQVGDFVVAIGNPYGLNQTVTSGIISALERNDLGIEGYENFIQTDAPINPGNSGGALVNLKGELIGINTAIFAPSGGNVGIGFAIPSNMATNIMQQLIIHGKLGRGIVGIMIQTVTPELALSLGQPNSKGAVITNISSNSPAEQSGLKVGDIIQQINDKQIKTAGEVRNSIGLQRVGSKLKLKILRSGSPIKVTLQPIAPEQFKQNNANSNPFFHDMAMKNFNAQLPGLGHLKGVQIVNIGEGSPGWQASLRSGDVVLSINNQIIKNLDDLHKFSDNQAQEILLNIVRGNGAIFVILKK